MEWRRSVDIFTCQISACESEEMLSPSLCRELSFSRVDEFDVGVVVDGNI